MNSFENPNVDIEQSDDSEKIRKQLTVPFSMTDSSYYQMTEKSLEGKALAYNDAQYLVEGGERLRELVETTQEKPKTIIFITRSGRLLSHFVRGALGDLWGEDQKPDIVFLQVFADKIGDDDTRKGINKQEIEERIAEIKAKSDGPYLVVDDYVTQFHRTYNIVKPNFPRDNDKYFAFIGQSEGFTELDDGIYNKDFYKKLGIEVGALDGAGSSEGFQFVHNNWSGTEKQVGSKYEKRQPTKQRIEREHNIRKTLYEFGSTLQKTTQNQSLM